MSKLSSQDVIEKGDYLETGFDPSSLTVVYLRAILQYHDVSFPSNANKGQLIKLFQENIVPNARKYKKVHRNNAAMPSDGSDIVDISSSGLSMEHTPIVRRRISRQSTMETPKRVASASPTRKGRKSMVAPQSSPKSMKADDDDSEYDKMSKSLNIDEGRKSRRVSQKWGKGDESSLWEDNNPFQTGNSVADVDLTRSITKPRKSRARPSSGTDFVPPKTDQNIFPAAGSLALGAFSTPARKSRLSETLVRSSSRVGSPATPYDHEDGDETLDDSQGLNGYPYVEGDSQTDILSRKIASLGEDVANGEVAPRKPIKSAFGWRQIVVYIGSALVGVALFVYQTDSAAIGYCDTGKSTNPIVLQHLLEIEAEKACREAVVKRADAGLPVDPNMESCKTTILPRATECTPCPPHAICSVHSIGCEPAYILKYNTLSSLPALDVLLNGFLGLGSVALPPRCVPDVKRRQHVGKMAGAIENKLATVRGDRICAGVVSTGGDAQDAAAYGMTVDEVKTSLSKRINPKAIHNFDEIFSQAITELKGSELLVSVRDVRGHEHFASIRGEISYVCRAKLFALSTWDAWKLNIIFSALAVLVVLGARSNLAKRALERRRVKGLVKEALERVKEQEARHYLDSVTYPTQSLSSLQLRDEMMADEHSIATRARVWEQVEKVVEENSNVRSNMEITMSGDEGRVWSWIGAGGGRASQFIDNSPTGRRVM